MESNGNETSEKQADLPDWLTVDIFSELLNQDVKNFERILNLQAVPAVATGENYMTILLKVLIKIQLTDGTITTKSYMVKVPPKAEEMRALIEGWRVFEKEGFTYKRLIPEFEKMYGLAGKDVQFGPKVLEIDNAKTVTEEALIMEDLSVRGFRNVKRQIGLDMPHTKQALEKLALFHAASACFFQTNGPYPDMYDQCLCSKEDKFADYRNNLTARLRESLMLFNVSQHLDEKLKVYSAIAPDQYQKKTPSNLNEFCVLNHGDFWSNNIMYQYKDNGEIQDILFVDFQMSRYGPPAQDLLYILLSSTCLENKFKHFDYFIHFYHEKLTANLKLLNYKSTLPLLKDLHISLFVNGDWAFTISTGLLPIILFDASEDAKLENIMGEDNKDSDLQKAMFKNKRYIEHISQLLPWMEMRGLLDNDPKK